MIARVGALALAVAPSRALGGADTRAAPLLADATFQSIGVVSPYDGDDDADNQARLEFREAGSTEWRPGLPMALQSLDDGDERARRIWAGSVVLLREGTEYEVRVVYDDPDGASDPSPVTVRTRSSAVASGSGASYYVDPSGSDMSPGTEAEPFRTIGRAAEVVEPGDTVWVKPGVYRETVRVETSGAPDAYITFESWDVGDAAVLDGADEGIATNPDGDLWTQYEGDVHSTAVASRPGYVAQEETRLFNYSDGDFGGFAGLLADQAGAGGGWYWDAGTLYLLTLDGSDPDEHAINVGVRDAGFEIAADYVWVKGLEARFYNQAGIDVAEDRSNNVIEGCYAHNSGGDGSLTAPIRLRRRSSANLVQDNRVFDTVFGWPWSIHGGPNANTGILLNWTGAGNVVRRNEVRGTENGIMTFGGWCRDEGDVPCGRNPAYYANTDVHDNLVREVNDDGIELEGSGVNKRAWGNVSRDGFIAYALAPVTFGPTYLFRNVALDFYGSAFKLGESSHGPIRAYHNTVYSSRSDAPAGASNGANGPADWGGDGIVRNALWRNNIVEVNRYVYVTSGPPGTADYDLLYDLDEGRGDGILKWNDNRYETFEEFQSSEGQEPGGIYADAALADPASGNLELLAASPAVDAGLVIPGLNDETSACPFIGSGPDMGAFELGAEGPCVAEPGPGGGESEAESEGDDEGPAGDEGSTAAGGCGCAAADDDSSPVLAALALLLAARRRSRRAKPAGAARRGSKQGGPST